MARGAIWLLALVAALAGVGLAHAETPARAIRIAADGDQARIVIDLAGPAGYQAFTLDRPDRLVVDLSGVVWRLQTAPRAGRLGAVLGVRTGQFDGDTARLVLDLARPMAIRDVFLLPPAGGAPYRLVLDVTAAAVSSPESSPQSLPESLTQSSPESS
ncbi:MAG: AMIN domain-containing protein, partial [Alphaproteobacteria bacterium]